MQSEIVISGISGRFPESDDVAEFSRNLYQKKDLISESKRWEPGLYDLPKRSGQLKDISKFDNEFFGVSEKQGHLLEPQGRILLETTYEAIVDAGYDPEDLRGGNIGVFIGNSNLDSQQFLLFDTYSINECVPTGCMNNMLANRISHIFDFKDKIKIGLVVGSRNIEPWKRDKNVAQEWPAFLYKLKMSKFNNLNLIY
ncbi:UNVERIFIED_CONTAM: Fatty acid synthase [Trichonephila clavipes]